MRRVVNDALASLIQILSPIRPERQVMEQMRLGLLSRWFIALGIADAVRAPTPFRQPPRSAIGDGYVAQGQGCAAAVGGRFSVDGAGNPPDQPEPMTSLTPPNTAMPKSISGARMPRVSRRPTRRRGFTINRPMTALKQSGAPHPPSHRWQRRASSKGPFSLAASNPKG